MPNFIYRISVDLSDSATVRSQICVIANTRKKADLRMRILAFNWWGYPEKEDEENWIVACENYNAFIPCEPDFIGLATDEEVETLKKFEYYFDVLKASSTPAESIIPDLMEALSYGLNLEDTKNAIIKYFGADIYARLVIEQEEET